ncbi:MAG: hypothetical protein IAE79_13960 [Anaerolinea sp.]|nr:hypothetical protein [Anaerolinea sp.]
MFGKKMIRIFMITSVLALGIWLAARPVQVPAETALRQQAMRSLAPGGSSSSEGDADATGQRVVYPPAAAATVDFATVDQNAPHGDSMYDRWLRGEIDLDENESILSAAEVAALQEAAMRMGQTEGVQLAQSGPGLSAPVPAGVSFASMDYNNGGGSVPPDPELAVGPNHMIAVVNVAVAMYDKSGNTVFGPVPAGSLYSQSPCTSGLYDPNVLYDEEADRWIIAFDQGAFSANGGYCLLASQTGNPLGAWNEYFFQTNSAGGWLDYPHAGVGDNFIFMGGNIFTLGGSYVEGRIYAFNKSNLYAGTPVSAIVQGLTGTYDTPQPINLHGASTGTWPNWGNTHYFMSEPYDGVNYTLFEWNTVTLTNQGDLAIGTGGMPVQVVQNGGSNIQANDWRPLDFEYRNGYGWTTATNSCNPGAGTVNCVLWAQVDLANAALGPAGSGVYSSNGDHRFFPDLAVNHCNDMALGYTKSSSSMFPSVWVTGRESGDPAGQLQAEVEMKAGEITYLAFDSVPRRWGDYTGMTIDPDGMTFWYLGEYSKITGNPNGRWGNYIGSFTYPDCSTGVNATIELTKTVGTDPSICAATDAITVTIGTSVTYCYTVENTGSVTLNMHDLVDSNLGNILSGFNYALSPGATAFLTETVDLNATTVNTATWTAYNPVGYTYDDTAPYNFEDISGTGTAVTLSDDQVSGAIPVGFTFNYYDINYTDIYISSNGFLTVLPGQPNGCCTGGALPATTGPNGTIAGWWEDLNPSAGGTIHYQTLGSAPNQYMIVQFTNIPHFGGGNLVTKQYKLFEDSNIIEVHYQAAPSDGGTHSAGIENETGTEGVQYYLGTSGLPTPLAVRYTPSTPALAQASDSATVTVLAPEIAINPAEFVVSQPVTTVVSYPLTISNSGDSDLDWTIDEAPGALAYVFPQPLAASGTQTGASELTAFASGDIALPTVATNPVISFPPLYAGHGGAIYYGDRPTFDAAYPGLPIEDFENGLWAGGAILGCPAPFDASTNNACFTPGGILPGIRFQDNPLNDAGGGDANGLAGVGAGVFGALSKNIVANTFVDSFEILFDPPVNATGMDMVHYTTDGATVNISIYDVNDVLIDSTSASATNVGAFWGVYSNTPIGRINILSTLSSGDGAEGVDNVAFGVVASGPCSAPQDLTWASVDPITGTVPSGGSTQVNVTFDTTGLMVGDTYTGTLCINSNDPVTPLVTVPLTLTVEAQSFGVTLSGDMAASGEVGTTVTYTIQITNTGNVVDTFDLTATGGAWTTTLGSSSVTLAAGASVSVVVEVDIPAGAADGDSDAVTITATSQSDPGASDTLTLTTTAVVTEPPMSYIYLPFIIKP